MLRLMGYLWLAGPDTMLIVMPLGRIVVLSNVSLKIAAWEKVKKPENGKSKSIIAGYTLFIKLILLLYNVKLKI